MEGREQRDTPHGHVGAAAATRKSGGGGRRSRFAGADDEGGGEGSAGGDAIECSGERCRSCTAGVVADCAAVCCCCPCAVVNLLALALVRVPYLLGRRCLARKKGAKKVKKKRKCGRVGGGSSERERIVEEGMRESVYGYGFEEGFGDGLEAERSAWLDLELYEVGHLSFGRVSFTGVQVQSKGGCS
ncbi:uncharacterized protein LOC125312978 [Rhodamnia argentea]|uniref:Uncharacterized protein LOC115751176 n=1 Tax=Rhodamnia argentea TaxID=178133 RepID=A0A8B8QCA5_9MYRT|nr:uncharacterized protein LOC115751176 [Rhodamnia argentea]XP_048129044.1 uncharacterized protein LOC125312978 [Rhodamnia argentea]